jgi:putative ABC transport system permease protein
MKGLFRPRNATRPVMVTLTASLTVILSIGAVEKNLDATFVRSYPPDAPNLFFVDIQPSQKDAFVKDLGLPAEYYPIVRGTVMAVNGSAVNADQERQRRGDNLAREFNLTYREHLLDDERIIAGKGLFRTDWPGAQVSVLDTVQKMRDMNVGDTLTFRIQGVPLDARISSIRTRTRASLQPFFYFVFPEQVLKGAPRTFFTAVRVGKESVGPLRNRIASRHPNVSVIDASEAVAVFARIMSRLSSIVRFFTLFSVVAGVLIIMSSVTATRYARIQEAVFFTVLGARGRFVLAVFALESLITGLASGVIALLFSHAIGWIVCRTALDIAYKPFAGAGILTVLAMTLIVTAAGLVASIPVLRQRPAPFLREQAEE